MFLISGNKCRYVWAESFTIPNKQQAIIRANELRIGNMLRWKDNGQQFDVMMANMADHYFWNHLAHGDIEGIPLTDEILEKCGFEEKHNHNADGDEHEWRQLDVTKNVDILQDWMSGPLSIGEYRPVPHIQYLHQLQNLFWSLCGEELQIKL